MSHDVSAKLKDEYATLQLGANIGRLLTESLNAGLDRSLCVFLKGDLGAGKTTLTRGLLRAARMQGVIKSPTYSVVESYQIEPCQESRIISLCTLDDLEMSGKLNNPQDVPNVPCILSQKPFEVSHFDLYRITSPEELEQLGIRDYFARLGICLFEWPDRGMDVLPEPDLIVNLEYQVNERVASLHSNFYGKHELSELLEFANKA